MSTAGVHPRDASVDLSVGGCNSVEEDKVVGDGYIVLVRVARRNGCNAEEEGKTKWKTSGAMVDRAPGAMKVHCF